MSSQAFVRMSIISFVFAPCSETLDMTSEGLGEMFEGDCADMCCEKFPCMLMWGRVEGLVCADPGVRTPSA